MPKVSISKYEERCRLVRGLIAKGKAIKQKSDTDLAKLTGKNPRLMESRNKNPGSFRLEELWYICDALGMSLEERGELLGGKRGGTS